MEYYERRRCSSPAPCFYSASSSCSSESFEDRFHDSETTIDFGTEYDVSKLQHPGAPGEAGGGYYPYFSDFTVRDL